VSGDFFNRIRLISVIATEAGSHPKADIPFAAIIGS
jgi:hypothetical protein